MPTIFTRIIDGEIPGTFVWRDERCVAFMSINPMAHGHVLVVPIDEVDHWIDASPELSAHLFDVTRHVAEAQRIAFRPARVGVIIAGYEVPHTHIHVIPTNDMSELSFANASPTADPALLEAGAGVIRAALVDAGHEAHVAGLAD
ncbi:MAG: HIT family protein [Ilumatobacteraceae bacterium]